jgi:hypothetical protein
MAIEAGWAALVQITGWMQSARAAAKDRSQQRFAHIVEHAGVIVGGMRKLNSQANRLLLPLAYFDPSGWPEEKRHAWADDLVMFAHEDVILPRMRASIASLRGIYDDIDDYDVRGVVYDILDIVGQLFLPTPYDLRSPHYLPGPEYVARYRADAEVLSSGIGAGVGLILANASSFDPDDAIRDELPELTTLLRTAQDETQAEQLRRLCRRLLDRSEEPARANRGVRSGRTAPSRSALGPSAERLQSLFGALLSHQARLFPALPTPDWVWAD